VAVAQFSDANDSLLGGKKLVSCSDKQNATGDGICFENFHRLMVLNGFKKFGNIDLLGKQKKFHQGWLFYFLIIYHYFLVSFK
jgi:hypothetical protein